MRRRFLFGALMLALFALGWWVGRGSSGDLYANLDVFVEVLQRVEDNYVDPVKPQDAIKGAIDGMLKDLDPYSQYLEGDDYGNLQDLTQGRFSGIGVVVGVYGDFPTVISPIEGSPAWVAGLQAGDIIAKIDDKSSSGLNVEQTAKQLRGAEGTKVKVTVMREGEEGDHDYLLTRQEIVTKSVPYAFITGKDLGYIRLANFSEKSGAEVRAALGKLRAQGARRYVLDLRMNPGGLLDQAVDVAEQFLPKGSMVVYTRGRAHNQDQRYYAAENAADTRAPLVVLIDDGSASASEIVAGALQDLDRALVVGRTSFGKGSVQSVFPLHGRTTALKLTTALYYTPSGRSIHKKRAAGAPDEDEVAAPPDTSADSTKSKPQFHTSGGRVVYGGGGITPDVAVVRDTLPSLARELERRGLVSRFASRWHNTHPAPPLYADPSWRDQVWREFLTFLRGENVTATEPELTRDKAPIALALRREIARRTAGDAEAMRVVLGDDPAFARASEILGRSTRASDVFATAVRDRSHDASR